MDVDPKPRKLHLCVISTVVRYVHNNIHARLTAILLPLFYRSFNIGGVILDDRFILFVGHQGR